jgi:hypothetical protein
VLCAAFNGFQRLSVQLDARSQGGRGGRDIHHVNLAIADTGYIRRAVSLNRYPERISAARCSGERRIDDAGAKIEIGCFRPVPEVLVSTEMESFS